MFFTKTRGLPLVAGWLCCLSLPAVAGDMFEQAVQTGVQANHEARASQERIDDLDRETERLLEEYRLLQRRLDSTRQYNRQLERLVAAQTADEASLGRQLDDIATTQREIVPLMLRMVDTLERFVELDAPFLPEERRLRVARLRAAMDRPDISLSEKYRRVLEAYRVEADYGRTLETYEGPAPQEDSGDLVNYLRLGRLVLMYQSPDGNRQGYWDQAAGQWRPLPDSYRGQFRKGLRMARKHAAPDLLELPVPLPEAKP